MRGEGAISEATWLRAEGEGEGEGSPAGVRTRWSKAGASSGCIRSTESEMPAASRLAPLDRRLCLGLQLGGGEYRLGLDGERVGVGGAELAEVLGSELRRCCLRWQPFEPLLGGLMREDLVGEESREVRDGRAVLRGRFVTCRAATFELIAR